MKKERVELVVPARNIACLEAAIAGGCDSVYISLSDFDDSDESDYVNYYGISSFSYALVLCRLAKVKVYVLWDMIIKNSELMQMFEKLSDAFMNGVSGIIIQDPAFGNIIRSHFPEVKIIMSDKAALMNSEAMHFVDCDRIILPKELSKEEVIQLKKNVKKPLEMTVQGWQCFSYGGHCLMSSMQGSKSANRNRCTYECRKPFKQYDYPLNMKDISLIQRIPELISLGIEAFRINGWIKSPFYIYHVSDIYRRAIDSYYEGEFTVSKADRNMLLLSLKRQLTDSFYGKEKQILCNSNLRDIGVHLGTFRNNGLTLKEPLGRGDTISFRKGRKVIQLKISFLVKGEDKIHQAEVGDTISLHFFSFKDGIDIYKTGITETDIPERKRFPVSLELTLKKGEPARLKLCFEEICITRQSEDICEQAQNHSLTQEGIKAIMNRISQSPFFIDSWKLSLDNECRISYSSLNKLKRDAIHALLTKIIEIYPVKKISYDLKGQKDSPKGYEIYARVYDYDGLKEAHQAGADIIYYDIFSHDVLDVLEYGKNHGISIYLIAPRAIHESSLVHIKKLIEHYNPEGLLIGDKALLSPKIKGKKHIDYNFNIANDISLEHYTYPAIVSIELSHSEILSFKNKNFILYAHGRPIVMTSRLELRSKELVNDRMDRFKVIHNPYKQTIILNNQEIILLDYIKDLYDNGIRRFYLDIPQNVYEVIRLYKEALSGKPVTMDIEHENWSHGHFLKGIN
jgi:U32 family peptidase